MMNTNNTNNEIRTIDANEALEKYTWLVTEGDPERHPWTEADAQLLSTLLLKSFNLTADPDALWNAIREKYLAHNPA